MPARTSPSRRIPRGLHPVAWWLWAAGLAVAASRTSNPLLLAMALAVLGYVVSARRTEATWARGFKYYLGFALIVVAIRVLFRSVFASPVTPADHILFSLPRLPMPGWYAGVQLGGAVSLEASLTAALDGLRLACILCCVGAANSLANPKRALRVLPGALYELGVAVTVSISVAPQLIDSVQRVHRARRLRAGRRSGLRGLRSIAVPVLEDALARSLQLAAAMDSPRLRPQRQRRPSRPATYRGAAAARPAGPGRRHVRPAGQHAALGVRPAGAAGRLAALLRRPARRPPPGTAAPATARIRGASPSGWSAAAACSAQR